jgi:hypothetical protein
VVDYGPTEYKVKLRRSDIFRVKPNAEQIDGKCFLFEFGWTIDADDTNLPIVGEYAMYPCPDQGYPKDAPNWIATGDLVPVSGGNSETE